MRRLAVLLLVTGVAAAAAGCGGGGQDAVELAPVTANDLAIMVLPALVIGPAAQGLAVDPDDSGFKDAAGVAQDTIDPEDTAEDIEQAGFRSDYELTYSSDDSRLRISTNVALFDSPEQAADFIARTVGGVADLEGKEVAAGVTLTEVDVEQVDGPGDTTWRGTATAEVGGAELTSSVVAFKVGPVAARVSATHIGDAREAADLDLLAQTLEERIRGVAAGEVSDTPVPIPSDEETSAGNERDPLLEQMVLSLDDLPDGVSIAKDRYDRDGGDVSFEREFALGTARVGDSALIGLQSNVERMDSAARAALAVGAVASVIDSAGGSEFFKSALGNTAGFEAKSVDIETIAVEDIGDKTTALHATFDSKVGAFEAVFVFIANGRAAGQIYAVGAKGEVVPDDILELARTMAERMEAGR